MGERQKTIINRINDAPLKKADWILLGIMALFMLATMFYDDLIIIYNHSLTFWDSFFSFDLQNFYANTLAKPYDGFGAVYYWIVYLVIGIWNLPVWLLQRFFGINVFSIKCLLWCRMEVVFFFFLTLWMMEKLLSDFDFPKEKIRFVQFLFASSLLVILPVAAISQIDIITIFFILWGIREYMSTDRITWKFLLIFAFAGALKIFALFLFFPLVLFREKRILHALCDMLVGLLFVFLSLFPYAGRADYIQATSILNDIVTERMFSTTFPLGNADVPIFLPLLAGICIWAYVTKPGGREETFYRVNWIALAVYASFFIFVFAHPYWIILIVPYLVILVAMNPQNMKINLILEFFLSFCISLFYIAMFGVYMTKDTFAKLVLPRIGFAIPQSDYSRLLDLVEEKEWELYVPALLGIFAVCMIAFLILNRPDREHAGRWGELVKEELRFDHGMIYLRLGAIAAFIAGCLWFAYGI